MELLAWTREWLGSERPTHGLREVQGVRRWGPCLRRHVLFVADCGCRRGHNCSERVGGIPMATRNSIGPWLSRIRRSAHIYADWCHLDAAPSSNYRKGVAGQRMVRREGYGRRDGHCRWVPLPQRLGLGGRCCTYSSLPGWCPPARYRGACSLASGHCRCHCLHYRCLSRVKVVVWTAFATPLAPIPVYGTWHAVEGRTLFSG